MPLSLTKPYSRLWSIEEGIAMVVTDLHGDWDAYQRYRDHFVNLQAGGQADCLILTGDLIHSEALPSDRSLDIVVDVLSLQASYGQAVIYLCGNHEMPHIYSISLARGDRVYTPDFERALVSSRRRAEIMALFDSLPFYLRTRAGVSLTHAGVSAPFSNSANAQKLFIWSHQDMLNWAGRVVAGEDIISLRGAYSNLHKNVPYDDLANYFLSVTGPEDPRYNDLLSGFFASNHPHFQRLLWPALFTRCEREYSPADYRIFLDALLQELSIDFTPQHLLVAGHINVKGGHQIIANRHLRIASGHHASPREAGQYLLLDTARPIERMNDLTKCLGSVFQ